jgi:hypothetical protein
MATLFDALELEALPIAIASFPNASAPLPIAMASSSFAVVDPESPKGPIAILKAPVACA